MDDDWLAIHSHSHTYDLESEVLDDKYFQKFYGLKFAIDHDGRTWQGILRSARIQSIFGHLIVDERKAFWPFSGRF